MCACVCVVCDTKPDYVGFVKNLVLLIMTSRLCMAPHLIRARSAYKGLQLLAIITHTHTHTHTFMQICMGFSMFNARDFVVFLFSNFEATKVFCQRHDNIGLLRQCLHLTR